MPLLIPPDGEPNWTRLLWKRAIPALQEALHDPEWKTRRAAAWAFGEIKDPTVIPALQEALHDPEGGVRQVAIKALDIDRL